MTIIFLLINLNTVFQIAPIISILPDISITILILLNYFTQFQKLKLNHK